MATEPLSPPRFRWSTHPTMKDKQARQQGAAYRAVREACGLGIHDISDATGTRTADLDALERGDRAFTSVADFQAALSQLWCWGSERGALR